MLLYFANSSKFVRSNSISTVCFFFFPFKSSYAEYCAIPISVAASSVLVNEFQLLTEGFNPTFSFVRFTNI